MRYLVLLLTVLVLLSAALPEAHAQRRGRPMVTPYGDFCPKCTQYGVCKTALSHEDAKSAMLDYYHEKGYIVEIINKRGRFIKAKIKDKRKIVDVIIFDRRTGRIRSIY